MRSGFMFTSRRMPFGQIAIIEIGASGALSGNILSKDRTLMFRPEFPALAERWKMRSVYNTTFRRDKHTRQA